MQELGVQRLVQPPIVRILHDERDAVDAPRAQRARGGVGAVAEIQDRLIDALACTAPWLVAPVEVVRDGLRRHAGASRDIADGCAPSRAAYRHHSSIRSIDRGAQPASRCWAYQSVTAMAAQS